MQLSNVYVVYYNYFVFILSGEKESEAREIILNKHIIRSVGEKVGSNWKKLATELQFPEDDIAYFESEGGSPAEVAVKVLTIWVVSTGLSFYLRECCHGTVALFSVHLNI